MQPAIQEYNSIFHAPCKSDKTVATTYSFPLCICLVVMFAVEASIAVCNGWIRITSKERRNVSTQANHCWSAKQQSVFPETNSRLNDFYRAIGHVLQYCASPLTTKHVPFSIWKEKIRPKRKCLGVDFHKRGCRPSPRRARLLLPAALSL